MTMPKTRKGYKQSAPGVKFGTLGNGNMAEDSSLPKGVPFNPGRLSANAKLKPKNPVAQAATTAAKAGLPVAPAVRAAQQIFQNLRRGR